MIRLIALSLSIAVPLWGQVAPLDPASGLPATIRPKKGERASVPEKGELFFYLDLLIWDALEEGLEFAYQNRQTQSTQKLVSFEPPSRFEPAFRLGAGGLFPFDRWGMEASYTFYSTNRKSSGSWSFDPGAAPGPGMISVWSAPSAFANHAIGARFIHASNQWRLHASFVDLFLSRSCAISSFFSLKPFSGLRSAFLHQLYQADYSPGNLAAPGVQIFSSHVNMHCDSNNIGPLFGCEALWRLGTRWSFFIDGSGALLASFFRSGRNETDQYSTGSLQTDVFSIEEKGWLSLPQGQLSLGFQFQETFVFGKRKGRCLISLAYEAELWWKQNRLLRYIDLLNRFSSGANTIPTQGNLLFHGANLEVQCGF